MDQTLTVPPGTRLVHIGPHKTGTTSIQHAFHNKRKELASHGVIYAGAETQPTQAVNAMLGKPGHWGAPAPSMQHWENLQREMATAANAGNRVLMSSERLANADDEKAAEAMQALGGDRPHVVVTLRPLSLVLSSAWQQYAQAGKSKSYAKWLDGVMRPPYSKAPMFWRWHSHDTLVRRWADAVGPENVTVICLDPSDRNMLYDSFEQLVGLPEGVLRPTSERAQLNRSLTYAEIALAQRLQREFERRKWAPQQFHRLIRSGAFTAMRRTVPDTSMKVTTPHWAAEHAGEIGEKAAAQIAEFGVRIVGDLSVLGYVPEGLPEQTQEPEPKLTLDSATQAVIGALQSGGLGNTKELKEKTLSQTSSRTLVRELTRRVKHKASHRMRQRSKPSRPAG